MIITRTPFRISFFGGGTDYPSWFRHFGGAVLATTIDKYSYLLCRHLPPFFDFRYSIVYSHNERRRTIDEIAHPAVRAVLGYLKFDRSLHLAHHGDLPARSGMGSSSAFTVGLLHTLSALEGRMTPKAELARQAIHVEQQLLKEHVGCQDQILTAYGGLNHITFAPSGEFTVRPVTIARGRLDELSNHLMLFYTGVQRTAEAMTASYVPDLNEQEEQLRSIGDMTEEGMKILGSNRDLREFGRLLHDAWQAKKAISTAISNAHVDGIYREARSTGAIGGKLLGAGGGGFMLLFVPPERQALVRERLARFVHVPFQFEFGGSQIVFADREEDYSPYDKAERLTGLADFKELDDLTEAV
ncbi:MAG: kinase [Candidatus Sungbacteria bacterium]|uniref:Kinase n=1 Tax=Candidatus Sungiibacteriota bacterium TaxID=2750080 RepID=A0A932YVR2_9BACT|nr:kinase [Candidatus Sungbacteria bacterium]